MVKKRPGRPRKRGRPKGSRNRMIRTLGGFLVNVDDAMPKINISTRLDKLMTEFETEMQRVMSKLKEMF